MRFLIVHPPVLVILTAGDVLETSTHTLRLSVDGTETFVKYDGAQPASVAALAGVSSEYNHVAILNLLTGSAWTPSGSMP